jgi:plasmid maintenance system antidote protein VapI
VNEKRGISPEMAVRLEKVFGGSAEGWLVQQVQYVLAGTAILSFNSGNFCKGGLL